MCMNHKINHNTKGNTAIYFVLKGDLKNLLVAAECQTQISLRSVVQRYKIIVQYCIKDTTYSY